jgi:gamma-glutamyltranspeptidase/glutathione hydrolase
MSFINPNPFTCPPEIEGTFRVVTSTHWIGTAVGIATLEKGGNAFDAALAIAFTLQVVNRTSTVRVAMCRSSFTTSPAAGGHLRAGPAPAGATIAHFRSLRRLRTWDVRWSDAVAARLRHAAPR